MDTFNHYEFLKTSSIGRPPRRVSYPRQSQSAEKLSFAVVCLLVLFSSILKLGLAPYSPCDPNSVVFCPLCSSCYSEGWVYLGTLNLVSELMQAH